MKKTGRNDPCPCGSGKKFKKCCESKMIGKKYLANKLDQASSVAGRVSGLTSFFQNKVTAPQPTSATKTFKASLPPAHAMPKSHEIKPQNSTPPKNEENQQNT